MVVAAFIPSIRRKAVEDGASHITVSDPVQHSEGMNKFTSFRVDVRGEIGVLPDPSTGGGGGSGSTTTSTKITTPPPSSTSSMFQLPHHSAVLRRYSDFVWLYERLSKERAGAILPPLPEKQAVARFSPEFIEERRFQLELFLRRVAVHPELYDASCFSTFLRADDVTFHAAKSNTTTATTSTTTAAKNLVGTSNTTTATLDDDYYYGIPTSNTAAVTATTTTTNMGGGDVFGRSTATSTAYGSSSTTTTRKKEGIKQWLAETKTSLQIATASVDLISSPDDALFEEMDRYIHALENQMKHVLNQVTALVRKGKEIANGMFEFGLAFGLLSQSEQEEGVEGGVASALEKMGLAADSLSVLAAEQAEGEEVYFESVLREYLRMIHAVKKALDKRAERRLTYTTCVQEVQTKRSVVDKYRGYPGKEERAFQAQASLQRAQDAAEVAREDFATVSQRILREMDRFQREKAEEMRYTVLNYIDLQIQYNQKMEDIWARLIPDLERIPTNPDEVDLDTTTTIPSGGGGGTSNQ